MIHPLLLTDFYKVGHIFQYPPGTQYVYSNFTPRKSRSADMPRMAWFGLQYFVKSYAMGYFERFFFEQPLETVDSVYRRRVVNSLGGIQSYDHIADLHALGYLPLRIKALPEGSMVPMRVPCMTITNTHPKFFWLPNFFETIISASIWQACTSATIAKAYRDKLDRWAHSTGMDPAFVQWQGHDFSFRGMSSIESAMVSGMGHLLSFSGTDTIPAIEMLELVYNADSDKELVGGSVPATEHSVMCAAGAGEERETYRRLVTQTYPSGIVSIVSDTWDLWHVLTKIMPSLKEEVMARNGKVVIRPDSGDPVKIICGDPQGATPEERKGAVELLWDTFGGTITSTGHRLLDSHVGLIYGDSITLDRCEAICSQLYQKGFASQVVFGIGSYTYQNNTRDTFGTAIKATHVVVDGRGRPIYKEPITDDGTKTSATGLLRVDMVDGEYKLTENVTDELEKGGALETVFEDGMLLRDHTLGDIRTRLNPGRW